MAKLINLSTPDIGVTDGMELSFRAPCDCSDVTGVTLDGVTYTLVDASGESLSGCSKYFVKNAVLTVIIDMVNKKANLLNPRVNTHTKSLGTANDTGNLDGSTVWAVAKQSATEIKNIKNGTTIVPKATHSSEADKATKLTTPRKINGVEFDGTEDILLPGTMSAKTSVAKQHIVEDTVDSNFIELNLYGESSQEFTPSPDEPCDIVSAENPEITVAGKNLAYSTQWSAGSPRTTSPPIVSNPYGTTISATSGNVISVTQSQYPDTSIIYSWKNGYLCFALDNGLTVGEKYRFSFDLTIKNNPPGTSGEIALLLNGKQIVFFDITNTTEKQRISTVAIYDSNDSNSDMTYIEFRCCGMSFDIGNVMVTPEEVTDITYEPAIEPQSVTVPYSLHGLGDIKDTIELRNGRVKHIARCGKIVVDNTMSFYKSATQATTGCTRFDYVTTKYPLPTNGYVSICTHYPFGLNTADSAWVAVDYGKLGLRIVSSEHDNVDDFNRYVRAQYNNGTPITFVYELAEPIVTDITDTEIGKKLLALHTNEPTTTIISECDFEAQYILSGQREIDYNLLNNRPITGDNGEYEMEGNLDIKGHVYAESFDGRLYGEADNANHFNMAGAVTNIKTFAESMATNGCEWVITNPNTGGLPYELDTFYGYAEVVKYNTQRKITYYNSATKRVYICYYIDKTWSDWVVEGGSAETVTNVSITNGSSDDDVFEIGRDYEFLIYDFTAQTVDGSMNIAVDEVMSMRILTDNWDIDRRGSITTQHIIADGSNIFSVNLTAIPNRTGGFTLGITGHRVVHLGVFSGTTLTKIMCNIRVISKPIN